MCANLFVAARANEMDTQREPTQWVCDQRHQLTVLLVSRSTEGDWMREEEEDGELWTGERYGELSGGGAAGQGSVIMPPHSHFQLTGL